ncbi:MAG: type I methionyl aminopeptidase [Clostridiales bacterium]|nr:type I methionyl aminopeptidase [Clostridiales bacterium]
MSITIKNEKELNKMRKAGKILKDTLDLLESSVFPGQTTNNLNKIAFDYITSQGGKPSFLNYEGFPYTICASKNEQVVHGFCDDEPLKEGDIISIDCGVIWEGYHSDAARTFPVGNVSAENLRLIEVTKQSFFEGIKDIKAGSRLGHISHRIQAHLEKNGYGVVRELVGHGIGTHLHEDPMVPNYGKYNSGIVLEEGMTLAIEPMSTLGNKNVYLEDNDWTVSTQDGLPSAHYENTVLITKDGVEILTL